MFSKVRLVGTLAITLKKNIQNVAVFLWKTYVRLVVTSSNTSSAQNSQETITLKEKSKYVGVHFVDHFFFRTDFGIKIQYVPLAGKCKTWPGRRFSMVIFVPISFFSSKSLCSWKKSSLKFGVRMVVPVPVFLLSSF